VRSYLDPVCGVEPQVTEPHGEASPLGVYDAIYTLLNRTYVKNGGRIHNPKIFLMSMIK
jgi:hypothetical protein